MAEIPPELEPYSVIKLHDDGDMTINHEGVRYVVTTEGDVFKEETKFCLPECVFDELEKDVTSEDWNKMSPGDRRKSVTKAFAQCAKSCVPRGSG